MDERAVFLTLTPSDNRGLGADAFRLLHNHSRYLKPSPLRGDDGSSREATPFNPSPEEDPLINLEEFHRIQLKFDQESKVKGRISFGSDPDRCDVLLTPKKGHYGTSGLHFYITFDDQQRPVVKDVSTNGLFVSYGSQAKDEPRNNFQWIIFPNFKEITVRLGTKKGPSFDMRLPTHYQTHLDEYKNKAKRFMAGAPRDPLQAFNDLALRSADTSLALSEALSSTRRPVYLKFKELGKGSYGRVYMAVNASTGFEYAVKEFFHGKGRNEVIEIMRGLRHEHIVGFVDFQKERNPLLVMEYLPLGNLEMQHQSSHIVDTDMMLIFRQCLGALDYLHSRDITHRGLKPQNILVLSRSPIGIKLADFGMAQDKSDLETFCGSAEYAAPEIFQGRRYTNTVDVWSLAVLVIEFIYGLPRHKQPEPMGELRLWGHAWCDILIAKANDEDSDILIDFLTGHMLRWDPEERLPAAECLVRAAEIGLFNETS
ncbi:MAG: hypothetical protein L6R35_001824 [Caloplaca aegaea]|nr:MAG: hypothetical protein L6R35_001824 [Caloplaca aegaea]